MQKAAEECVLRVHLDGQADKKKVTEIVEAIVALLNNEHDGGKLELSYQNLPKSCIFDYIRRVEQSLNEIIGSAMLWKVDIKTQPQNVVLNVKAADTLVTMNYNLYWPTETQVLLLQPLESTERAKEILLCKNGPANKTALGSHHRKFVKDKESGLQEDKCNQFKNLKCSPSKCMTLGDRIVGKSNKLSSYVSAFANYAGGHIYFGIADNGTVEGEEITERSKEEIENKVAKCINKMIWPCGQQKKGVNWDIFFEPVEGDDGNVIPSMYVIVVYVGQCPGGVFVATPKSFRVEKNKPEQMSFEVWKHRLLCREVSPALVPRKVDWSSPGNKEIYRNLTRNLVQLRNDKNLADFRRLGDLVIETFPESGAELIVLAEKAAIAYKNHYFQKARSLYERYQQLLNMTTKDRHVYEIRGLYLLSRIARAEGDYQRSYDIAQDGLQKMQDMPPEFITVWFYIHTAELANHMGGMEDENHRGRVKEAVHYLERAAADANNLEGFETNMIDLQQKLRIYKASILLGCPLSGAAMGRQYIDIDAADSELEAVKESSQDGHLLTSFRNIQFLLVQCDLFRRRAEVLQHSSGHPAEQLQPLMYAFQFAEKARHQANKLHFEEMVHYAGTRLRKITIPLIVISVQARRSFGFRRFSQELKL